jgi:diacylglycerol O-acyltransferase
MERAGGAAALRRDDARRAPIWRAGAADRAFLAMDVGPVPEQFGVLLELEGADGLDLAHVRKLLDDRIRAVPRLRQRLVRAPLGCGGPIWVDDADFDIRDHVHEVACGAPGDEQALLDTALATVMSPLPRDAPLWSATSVTGLADGRTALVVTLHHVLSDGVGGLAVLAALVDPGGEAGEESAFPRPRPGRLVLAHEALTDRLRALRHLRRWWHLLRSSFGAGGGLRPPRIAECSLLRRTGPHRRLSVVRGDREMLRVAARRYGATTNDAVLVAVAGALGRVLAGRGEHVEQLVLTVPVSGRAEEGTDGLGNLVSPILVPVPTAGEVGERLAAVSHEVRARKTDATGPAPIALLGWLFRPVASHGGYRWYLNHQRRFHTLVSHVRGPGESLTFSGAQIVSAVPIGVAEAGNATAYFEVLSYRDDLTVCAVVDPDRFPDLEVLTGGLRAELDLLVGASRAPTT